MLTGTTVRPFGHATTRVCTFIKGHVSFRMVMVTKVVSSVLGFKR